MKTLHDAATLTQSRTTTPNLNGAPNNGAPNNGISNNSISPNGDNDNDKKKEAKRDVAVRHESQRVAAMLSEASRFTPEDALKVLETSHDGLTDGEAAKRRIRHGKNAVAHEKAPSWFVQLGHAFLNPFIGVLVCLMLVSYVLDVRMADAGAADWKTVIVLSIMITASALLRFFTEFRSNKAAQALQAMVKTTATVTRRDESRGFAKTEIELPIEFLVPGDIVRLGAGDMIPADVRLLSSKDLFVSQSVLTGESMPVEKFDTLVNVVGKSTEQTTTGQTATGDASALDMGNIAFMGTNVISGAGTAVVVTIGSKTFFGSMARGVIGQRAQTSFDIGINKVSFLLIKFMLVMVPIVFLINGFTKHNWMEALLFSLSVAVGLTPEMLPMIVSANLAKGALLMSRKKVIVKRLNAIQNFGAMNILCTDKTGTITRDQIVLERYVDLHGEENLDVLEYAYLNSHHQTGLKNLLDRAVLEHVELDEELKMERLFDKVDEIPFDFNRRRMSVIVAKDADTHLLICKGAVEEVLSHCTHAEMDADMNNTEVEALTPESCLAAQKLSEEMNEEGFRVVAIAYREMSASDKSYGVADESDMILVGFVGFLDPPKESARHAIAALKEHGVEVKVLTGDNELVTRKVCGQVGLPNERVVLGREIEALNEEELANLAERETLFAKLSPAQKARIIRALRGRGHTVGYLGDGINDAAALRDADVGISVDTAADIAKESADIIMFEKNLMVLEEGVLEGRNTFGNIIKYIKMTASSNFGNVFSMLVASAFIPFLPMLPIHLLIQNMLYDFSQTTIPFDRVDKEYLKVPRKWYAGDIGRFMLFIGPISSIFDITTFLLMWYVFKANSPAHQSLFQSGWFIEGLLSQTLVVHMIRTQKIPFIQSCGTWPLLLATFVICSVGIAFPFTPFGAHVGLHPLPLSYFPWLALTLLSYCVLTQTLKTLYIRKFQMWL